MLAHEMTHVIQLRDMTSLEVWKNQGVTARSSLSMECYAELAKLQVKMTGVLKHSNWPIENNPVSPDVDKKYRAFFIQQCRNLTPQGIPSTYYLNAVAATSKFFIADFYKNYPTAAVWYKGVENPQDVVAAESADGHFPRKHYMEPNNPALAMTFEQREDGFWMSSRYMVNNMIEKLQDREIPQEEDASLALASLIQQYNQHISH
jgi:hypothetical protein